MVYKWYILPIGGLYATYHRLGEPETTIDLKVAGKMFLFLFGGICKVPRRIIIFKLVVSIGFNPFEKYARQIGSFPQVGVKMKNM